ncbi:MAG: IS4 family transposase [Clostridiaceae bacterium]|nr:IS4 family transposase [Clostridiaceae bacterium]
MNSGKYVFRQMLDFVNQYEFNKCVKRYSGNYRVRDFKCWNQFVQLLFGQITSLDSLRSICTCLQAHKDQLYHLGVKQSVDHTTFSRANENRDWHIFADFGEYLIGLVRPLYADNPIPEIKLDNEVFALDSTTISLSINLFTWAEGKYTRGAVKVHTLINLRGSIPEFILVTDGKYHDSNALDVIVPQPCAIYLMDKAYVDFEALHRIQTEEAFFVTRAKSSLRYEVVEQNFNIDQMTGLRSDKTIILTVTKSKRFYPDQLRLVEYYDAEKDLLLVFLSNNFEVSALEIARLYKNRWQIEVFFKWIKQNLVIKKLWGHSPNAVKIHVWTAIGAYLIVAYIKHTLKSDYSIYEIMQILSVSAFDKTPIRDLLTIAQVNQNAKELQFDLFDIKF